MIVTSIRILNKHRLSSDPTAYVDLALNSTAGENGYILKRHEGLDPSETITFTEGFGPGGSPVNTSRPEKKEIVLHVGFVAGQAGTYSELRDRLYRMMSRSVRILLMSGETILAEITGWIRSFDVELASNQPDAQLTIKCDDGFFVSPTQIAVPTAGLSKSIPIINGIIGTAPASFYMAVVMTSNAALFGVNNNAGVDGGDPWHFTVGYPFLTGDHVAIQTEFNNRSVIRTRSSVALDITSYLQPGSTWPSLYPGEENKFYLWVSAFNWDSISYYPKYWGV